jgi:hypothetical protein
MELLDTSLEIITYNCVDCKRTLPKEGYYCKKSGVRHTASCKACYQLKRRGYQIAYASRVGNQKRRNRYCPEKRSEDLVKSYGLTLDKYNQIVKVQGGGCAICGSKQAKTKRNGRFCIDHNHVTGEVRGLLCAPCNRGIGLLGDNPDTLKLAAEYLLFPPSRRAWDC